MPGHRALNSAEPLPQRFDQAPPPPDTLGAAGRAFWASVIDEACRLGMVTILDPHILELAAQAYEVVQQTWLLLHPMASTPVVPVGADAAVPATAALPFINQHGQISPIWTAYHAASRLFLSYSNQLGIAGPASRVRLRSDDRQGELDFGDDWRDCEVAPASPPLPS